MILTIFFIESLLLKRGLTYTHFAITFSLSKDKISQALNAILESMIESIEIDEKIEIRGFGTFSKKYIRPRKFINPKTKKISYLGETATLHFKPSKSLVKK